ncbi:MULTISPECIES: hypothetical protein [unclassified Sphingomonas]|uniref:hypothetical protein n=1 Tax=unclassified Sphingomonas TaxID=196159 RepID=UPI0012E11A31|nr:MULTISPECIES: hypothetical protein [unclassified Sphingomonas]
MSQLCACGAPLKSGKRATRCNSCAAIARNSDPLTIARRRITRWGDWSADDIALYQDLRDGKGFKAAEAKLLVLDHRAVRCAHG